MTDFISPIANYYLPSTQIYTPVLPYQIASTTFTFTIPTAVAFIGSGGGSGESNPTTGQLWPRGN